MPSGEASHIARKRASAACSASSTRLRSTARATPCATSCSRSRSPCSQVEPTAAAKPAMPISTPSTTTGISTSARSPSGATSFSTAVPRNWWVRGMRTTPPAPQARQERRRQHVERHGARSRARAFIARRRAACHSCVSESVPRRLVELVVEGAIDAPLQADRGERPRDRLVGRARRQPQQRGRHDGGDAVVADGVEEFVPVAQRQDSREPLELARERGALRCFAAGHQSPSSVPPSVVSPGARVWFVVFAIAAGSRSASSALSSSASAPASATSPAGIAVA